MRARVIYATLLVAIPVSLCAQKTDLVTVLSRDEISVGEFATLVYRFVNMAEPANMPQKIAVEGGGAEVNLTGSQRQSNFSFGAGGRGQSESVLEYTYAVRAVRPGMFAIPGFTVDVGGRAIKTEAVGFRAVGSHAAVPRPAAAQPMTASNARDYKAGERYFGEIVMENGDVYVGQVVPVELRFYFRADCQFNDLRHPTFGGEGFAAAALSDPEQSEQYIEGTPYNAVTFRTSVTPAKSGELEIPPALMEGQMVTPGSPSGRDPFFDQFFQNFPMPGSSRTEKIQASTGARRLDVKELPQQGRPESFSGAVGQFTMKASAEPGTAAAGEPIALTLRVEGRGNFDATLAPELDAAAGWRVYLPKEAFRADDGIGFGGAKSFEYKIVARADRTATPGAIFSYFDPSKKEYVTLKTEPIPVDARGRESSAADNPQADMTGPADPVSRQEAVVSPPSPAPSNDVTAGDPVSFEELWLRWFRIGIGLAAVALVAAFLWRRVRKRSG